MWVFLQESWRLPGQEERESNYPAYRPPILPAPKNWEIYLFAATKFFCGSYIEVFSP